MATAAAVATLPSLGYAGDGLERWIAFVAGFLLTILQDAPFRGQILAGIIIGFFIWIWLKHYILLWSEKLDHWEKQWVRALKKLIGFVTYTLFFLVFYYTVFLLEQEWSIGNVNVQEIIVIILAFIILAVTIFVIYQTRLRAFPSKSPLASTLSSSNVSAKKNVT